MSLSMNSSPEAAPRPNLSTPMRKSVSAPVFKPDFVRSVRMHPMIAGVVALVVFAAIVAFGLSQKPMYEAEALVYVEPSASKVLDDGTSGAFDANKYDSYLQQQVQTSQRLDILKSAVHALPVGVWRGRSESEEQAAQRLQTALKVERVLNSYQLSFTLKGPTAQGAAQTLNAVIAAFLAAGRQDELSLAGERVQILSEEKARISAELATARTEQATLSSSLGMANPGLDADNPYDSQLAGLRTQLGEAREAHDVAAAQLASVSGSDLARTQGLTAAADELIAGDSGLSSMKATISQRRAVLSGQMAGLTTENPIYKQDQTEIADLDRTLEAMTTQMRDKAERRLQDKLRTDLARTGDVEARLNAQLASQTYAATSAAPKLQRAAELSSDVQRLMKRYATVDDSLRSVQLETSGPGMAHLALAAATPVYPVPSRRKLTLLAALPIGLLCGAFAAVFFRKRDPHIYTGRDLEELLGFTPIAVLPAPDDVPDGVMQEYVLRLAGGIENAFRTAGARSFVLTPAGTSVALDGLTRPLAAKLRQLGLGVSTTTARTMMELGSGRSAAGEAATAKPAKPDKTDTLADTKHFHGSVVEARLEDLKQQSDLVFIDAPALLTSAETEYLVRCADATILIATSGVTRRGDLLQATLLLERLGVKGVGAVLEGLHLRFADGAYRVAVAELDRRQSFEDRARTVLEPRGQEQAVVLEPAVMQAPAGPMAFAPAGASNPSFEAAPDEVPHEVPTAPEMVENAAEVTTSVPALSEMIEAPRLEPALALPPEVETARAPAQGTEETVPMAMHFIKFEQPDRPVQSDTPAEAPEQVSPVVRDAPVEEPVQVAAVQIIPSIQSTQSTHRRAPVLRVQPEPEIARNWFQRIFQRDAEPIVSIVPDEEEDEAEGFAPATAPVHAYANEDLDIPPKAVILAPAADSEPEVVGVPEASAEPVGSFLVHAPEIVYVPEAHASVPAEDVPTADLAHLANWSAAASVREVSAGHQDAMPAAEVQPEIVHPLEVRDEQPARDVALAPVAWADEAVPESASIVQAGRDYDEPSMHEPAALEPAVLTPAALEPVYEPVLQAVASAPVDDWFAESAAEPQPMAAPPAIARTEPEARPPAQPERTPVAEPFRTGRWEAARQTSRSETTPWRDRRISGPNAIYGAPERRFNWNTEAAKPLSLVPNPAADRGSAERTGPRAPERPAPAPVAPVRLTRKWGLLSRFEDPQSAGGEGREQERQADQASGSRGYRRG